ncbi:MAG: methylated-DNA--[protein]-cysteine S-methyltransferase [Candidatus Gastranaerophilales bacterium]|nr:methylated-DNA--[protein]-cysteine S-methyltransferase [Candidatus Gastranaerophilales bacterium]MCM1073305.1 methylated-DNA--[protein]-cysteine S-methyltransferase [Bacteroides sp.]
MDVKYYKTAYSSPVGNIVMASDGNSLTGLWFEGQKYFAATIGEDVLENNDLNIFSKTKNWLDRYFQGRQPEISELLLNPFGNSFRQRVWQILCEIPYGSTMTYGEIAQIIARENGKQSMSAQAVGGAVGHNPISIIIPCHRVVGANGKLTGYAGGIEKKIKLLMHEGVSLICP